MVVGSPHARRTEPPGKPTKIKTLRTHHGFGACSQTEPSAVFSCFRVFAIMPSPARTLIRPTHRKPARPPPPFVLSCFRVPLISRPAPEASPVALNRHNKVAKCNKKATLLVRFSGTSCGTELEFAGMHPKSCISCKNPSTPVHSALHLTPFNAHRPRFKGSRDRRLQSR